MISPRKFWPALNVELLFGCENRFEWSTAFTNFVGAARRQWEPPRNFWQSEKAQSFFEIEAWSEVSTELTEGDKTIPTQILFVNRIIIKNRCF
jgi:hypothetical protein